MRCASSSQEAALYQESVNQTDDHQSGAERDVWLTQRIILFFPFRLAFRRLSLDKLFHRRQRETAARTEPRSL
jgi:hypothetical protein